MRRTLKAFEEWLVAALDAKASELREFNAKFERQRYGRGYADGFRDAETLAIVHQFDGERLESAPSVIHAYDEEKSSEGQQSE